MTLIIEAETEKGKTQLEAIRWTQEQINLVLQKYFNNNYKLLKGLQINFRIPNDPSQQQSIAIDINEAVPKTKEDLDKALSEVTTNIVVEDKKDEPNKK